MVRVRRRHLNHDGQVHADHAGDMPSAHLNSDGTANATFTIDRIDIDELDGRVVSLHAGPNNFGNVAVGNEPNQYTPTARRPPSARTPPATPATASLAARSL